MSAVTRVIKGLTPALLLAGCVSPHEGVRMVVSGADAIAVLIGAAVIAMFHKQAGEPSARWGPSLGVAALLAGLALVSTGGHLSRLLQPFTLWLVVMTFLVYVVVTWRVMRVVAPKHAGSWAVPVAAIAYVPAVILTLGIGWESSWVHAVGWAWLWPGCAGLITLPLILIIGHGPKEVGTRSAGALAGVVAGALIGGVGTAGLFWLVVGPISGGLIALVGVGGAAAGAFLGAILGASRGSGT